MDKPGYSVVVIGGGTGSFTLLSTIKDYAHSVTALVNMADDGGSTGVLRDELGALPPGDVRQCLVALSQTPKLRELFNYRFEEGTFQGHAFGNIFLSALEKMTGSFAEAVQTASEVLRVKGKVVPATLDNVRLIMEWPDLKVTLNGEGVIDEYHFQHDPRQASLRLTPPAKINPAAAEAIKKANLIVIAPGDLYTSLGPLLVIDGMGEALQGAIGKIAYVCNLVTKEGQTEGFGVSDHAAEIERFAGNPILDYVLYNKEQPTTALAEKYKAENAYLVSIDPDKLASAHYEAIGGDFLADDMAERKAGDMIVTRSLIRHDADAVAQELIKLSSQG
jgi:uncharacterized cofD-like protein